jgi:pSer/pThr/pTyr-binding forkhead associated (FHA) protein/predicted Zn-ribbon and HTH transcriptional regulator
MIATSFPSTQTTRDQLRARKEQAIDRELTAADTFVGAGSFRCRGCGYVLTLTALDKLTACPECGSDDFARAPLFSAGAPRDGSAGEPGEETMRHGGALARPEPSEHDALLAHARDEVTQPGEYLCFAEGGDVRTVALTREWTRIGRSLAADVRFDDPTVSRRHALIVRQPDGVRVLDDRSLNGVFVNGERIEGRVLKDGDEIVVGRYRLAYLVVPRIGATAAGEGAGAPPPTAG